MIGNQFTVKRVEDDPELLSFLTSIHIELGTTVNIINVDGFNEVMQISVNHQPCVISFKNASRVFGENS
jgi:Fe2+ transport system protein FeoA